MQQLEDDNMSKTKGTMKGMRPLSQSKLKELTEYKVDENYTREIPVSERISYKIRKTKVISPEGNNEGVDLRRFVNTYPSKQGCMIPLDKWLSFMQEAINFTVDIYGVEVFCRDEPEPQTPPAKPAKNVQRGVSQDDLRRMSVAGKSVTEVNWGELSKMSKKKN